LAIVERRNMTNDNMKVNIAWQAFGCKNYCQQCFLTCKPRNYAGPTQEEFFKTAHRIYQAKEELGVPFTTWILSEQLAPPYWRELLRSKEVREIMYYGIEGMNSKDQLGIATNGHTLAKDKKAAQDLITLGVKDISLSFYAGSAALHDSLAGRRGAFEDLKTAMYRVRETGKLGLDILVYPYEKTVESIPRLFEEFIKEIEVKDGKQPLTTFQLTGLHPVGRLFGKEDLLPREKQIDWLIRELAGIAGVTDSEIQEKYVTDPAYFDSEKKALELRVKYYEPSYFRIKKPKIKLLGLTLEDGEIYHFEWSYLPPRIRNKRKELFYIGTLNNGESLTEIIRNYYLTFDKNPINRLRSGHEKEIEKTWRSMLKTADDRMRHPSFLSTWFTWRLANLIENNQNEVVRPGFLN
jgi:MoaA/NifB/PqqE/SkfB family radical SAM enzyme